MRILSALIVGAALFATPLAAANKSGTETNISARTGKAAVAKTADKPTLRRATKIAADVVRLSDLFDNVDPRLDRVVSYAPQPGRSAIFDSERLRNIARSSRLRWRPKGRFERVVVTRASQVIDNKSVIAEVRARLRQDGIDGDLSIALDRRQMEIHLPVDAVPSIALRRFRYDPRTRRFSATIEAPADAPQVLTPVAGRVHELIEVPVLKHSVKTGQVIRNEDIEWTKMRVDRIGHTMITDASALAGKAPRRLIQAGKPLRESDVRTPIVIRKGSIVTMIYRTPLMSLTSRGRALENGSKKGVIRVMNSKSKRTVDAQVVNSDTVVVKAFRGLALND